MGMEPNPLLIEAPRQEVAGIVSGERGKKTRRKRRENTGGNSQKKAGIADSQNRVVDKIINDFRTYYSENFIKYCSDMHRANMMWSPKLLHSLKK
jgi:hypothetical protein